jgi:hypothetical protein
MADEYMTIEELRELAREYDIYIPYRYKKDEMIEVINDYFYYNPKRKTKSSSKSNSKVLSYAPTFNIVNNYYTVSEIKEIAKLNDIDIPSKLTKEELILIINSIINDRFKNKTPQIQVERAKSPEKKRTPKPENPISIPKVENLLPVPPKPQQPQQQPKPQQPQQQPKPQQPQQQPKPQQPQQQPQQPKPPKLENLIPVPKPKSPQQPQTKTPPPKLENLMPNVKPKSPQQKPKTPTPPPLTLLPIPEPQPRPEKKKPELNIQLPVYETVSDKTDLELPILPATQKKPFVNKVRSLPRIISSSP